MASASIPSPGMMSWWPTPARLYPSTSTVPELLSYWVLVHPDCGVVVVVGVWLTPSTFVHCLISSP